jgi:hypothetical protein
MDQPTRDTLRAVEQAVGQLIERCPKPGPLHSRSPRAVTHVSRTSRWLLFALAALERQPYHPNDLPTSQG